MAGIPSLNNSVVFSTKTHVAAALAKELGYFSTPAFKMKGCRAVTITPNKGDVIIEKFEDMDSRYVSSAAASSSLGFNVGSTDTSLNKVPTYNGDYGSSSRPVTKQNSTLLKNSKTKVYNHQTNQMELITHTTTTTGSDWSSDYEKKKKGK